MKLTKREISKVLAIRDTVYSRSKTTDRRPRIGIQDLEENGLSRTTLDKIKVLVTGVKGCRLRALIQGLEANRLCAVCGDFYTNCEHLPVCVHCTRMGLHKQKMSEARSEMVRELYKDTHRREDALKKRRLTSLKKYGVDHSSRSDYVKKKIRQTNLHRYGSSVACNTQGESREKRRATMIHRYGSEHALRSEEVLSEARETNLRKLGVPYPLMSKTIQKKAEATNTLRYGVRNASQSAEIHQKKIRSGSYKHKYVWHRGEWRGVSGYEDFAYNKVLKPRFGELRIRIAGKEIPYDNGRRRYLPDFMVRSRNTREWRAVEVKSDFTFKRDLPLNRKKAEVATFVVCYPGSDQFLVLPDGWQNWKRSDILGYLL